MRRMRREKRGAAVWIQSYGESVPATAPGRTSRGRGRAQIQRCSDHTAATQDSKDTEDTEDRSEDTEVTMTQMV